MTGILDTGDSGDADGVPSPDRVELLVRSLAPQRGREQQESIVERLTDLESRGRVNDVDVHLCGNAVCARTKSARTDTGQFLLRRLAAFEAWASATDRRLVGFEEQDVESSITGSRIRCVAFPRVVLAEYRDDELSFIAPSEADGAVTSVTDRLDAIEAPVPAGPSRPV